MEALAKHEFKPEDPQTELAFNRGDRLLILNYGENVHWYDAELNGRKGLVPGNYITIDRPDWYHGKISRTKAEQYLMTKEVEGAFLVRLSESSPTEFSLSVRCAHSVQHFRILKHNETSKYFLWSEQFDSLNELVEYYRTHTVSKSSDIYLQDTNRDHIVEAIYDFIPQNEPDGGTDELGFKRGDLIAVFDKSDEHWWGGMLNGKKGFFPRTYVKDYQEYPFEN